MGKSRQQSHCKWTPHTWAAAGATCHTVGGQALRNCCHISQAHINELLSLSPHASTSHHHFRFKLPQLSDVQELSRPINSLFPRSLPCQHKALREIWGRGPVRARRFTFSFHSECPKDVNAFFCPKRIHNITVVDDVLRLRLRLTSQCLLAHHLIAILSALGSVGWAYSFRSLYRNWPEDQPITKRQLIFDL